MSPPDRDLANGLTCGYYVWCGISSHFSFDTAMKIQVLVNRTISNSTTYFNSTTSVVISNLRKFTVYEIYVAAFTVFGRGTKGNYSHRTLQDGEKALHMKRSPQYFSISTNFDFN